MKQFLSSTVYKDVLNTVSDCIFILELDTLKIVFANEAAHEFSAAVLGKRIQSNSTVKSLFKSYAVFHDEKNTLSLSC